MNKVIDWTIKDMRCNDQVKKKSYFHIILGGQIKGGE